MSGAEKKKYKVIAKAGGKAVGENGFVKYNVNDLLKFTQFLDATFPDWRYFNVFRYTKEGNGERLESFTKYKRPTHKFLML